MEKNKNKKKRFNKDKINCITPYETVTVNLDKKCYVYCKILYIIGIQDEIKKIFSPEMTMFILLLLLAEFTQN